MSSRATPDAPFTEGELAYLAARRIGRLATLQPNGTLQVNPVSCYYNAAVGTIDVGGHDITRSQKFRNVAANQRVAVVFDDIVSFQPLHVRCLEVRGRGEVLTAPTDSAARVSGAIIRIHPQRIIGWGIDPPHLSRGPRNVS